MKTQLKPCPFCKNKLKSRWHSDGYWFVFCEEENCILHEGLNIKFKSEEDLIKALNTRNGEE
jgi:hypothetical protein